MQGPAEVADKIINSIDWLQPPIEIRLLILQHLTEIYAFPPDKAQEATTKWHSKIKNRLLNNYNLCFESGKTVRYEINSSDSDFIQGASYINEDDSNEIAEFRKHRAHFDNYKNYVENLNPRRFECLCGLILHLLGVKNPIVTKGAGDDGIDFFGLWELGEKALQTVMFPNFEKQMKIWLVGQAKHYTELQVSTPDVRELIGSIELAKSSVFSYKNNDFDYLKIRPCDPIYYLFITSGNMSSKTHDLLDKSGVIGIDGNMIAAFLADKKVATVDGRFLESLIDREIARFEKN